MKKFEKLNPLKKKTTNRLKKEGGLKNRRDKKLSSKLSMDTQLFNISKEELSHKRKLVEQLGKSEEEFNSGMNKVFRSMENISSFIQQTVGILADLVNQQQTLYQQQYWPPFSSTSFNHQSVPQYGHPPQRNVQNEYQGSKENERVHEKYQLPVTFIYHFTLQVILTVTMLLLIQNI